ncbi:MAG: hypothetical protein HOP28_10570, partial [Gemmatimonadales bacterium]|nr:hypothetical protein [Gemmatimonadales bacterium]
MRDWHHGLVLILLLAESAGAQRRAMQPEDLFRIERIGATSISPDGSRIAVEIHRPGRWLGSGIPTAKLAIVDVASGALRVISPSTPAYVGFFGARWSPTGGRLLFLSVDTNAVVRPWLWSAGASGPVLLGGLQLRDASADPPIVMWSDPHHAIFMVKEPSRPDDGPLYTRILRARRGADEWRVAREGRRAAVAVIDSRSPDTAAAAARIVSVDLRTRAVTTLAQGALHRPMLSADGKTLTYRRENPGILAAPVASFFGPEAEGEGAYDPVNWGGEVHHVDSRTGTPAPPPDAARAVPPSGPRPALRAVNDSTGSVLWLSRPGKPDTVV